MSSLSPAAFLAQLDQVELWRRADRLHQARDRVCELSSGLPGAARSLLAEIDAAHRAVEAAERALVTARLPLRRAAARRALDGAYAAEQSVLNRAGFSSWSAFALRRIGAAIDPKIIASLVEAERELARATAAWRTVSEGLDVDVALAARPEVEAIVAGPSRVSRRAAAPTEAPAASRSVTAWVPVSPAAVAAALSPGRRLAAG